MTAHAEDAEVHPDLGKFVRAYRTDRTGMFLMIVLLCVCLAFLGWAIYTCLTSTKGDRTTGLLLAVFLTLWVPAVLAGIWHHWNRAWQRYRLHEAGLEFVSGGHATPIAWDQVEELYESFSSTTMLGITVERPKQEVELVTEDGTRCRVDKVVVDYQSLAAVVADRVLDSLRRRAQALLRANQPVPVGLLTVSTGGIVVNEPRSRSLARKLQDMSDPTRQKLVIRPGEYSWDDLTELRIVTARRNDSTFNQVEILGPGRWGQARLFAHPVPSLANFAVLCEVLAAVGHPLQSRS